MRKLISETSSILCFRQKNINKYRNAYSNISSANLIDRPFDKVFSKRYMLENKLEYG